MNRKGLSALLIVAVLAWTAVAVAATLPAGTSVKVRLQNSVSSAKAKSGESFEAVLDEALVVNGKTVAPKGATVKGTVAKAVPSGRLKTPAELYLRLKSIEVGGKAYTIRTASVGRKEGSHTKRNTTAIGGGAAAGAIIGAIAGGGKGAAIGAGAGAAAGTAGAAMTGKKDVEYPVETRLTFKLTAPATLP
jgi:hypothetical protein